MNYEINKIKLKNFYDSNGKSDIFEKDIIYLEKAFHDINKIWFDNFDQIETVHYLMIGEAPLWGTKHNYIYNPETKNTQFFYRNDLGKALNRHIEGKTSFIRICNEIGFLMMDISPFPFNKQDTAFTYQGMSKKLYREVVNMTLSSYFEEKIKIIAAKKSDNIKVFFRYTRVKNIFQDIISKVLMDHQFIKSPDEIFGISQHGGGIDRERLKHIIRMN